jgi:hypothetical protein
MSPKSVALLLRKQRLQFAAAEQRRGCLAVLQEIESGMDRLTRLQTSLRNVGHSLQGHVPALALAGLALLIWRPRGALRWLQRGWLVYLGTQRWRRILDSALVLVRKLRGETERPSPPGSDAAMR